MEDAKFDRDKFVNYWIDSSDEDFETMIALYDSKRYSWSMFVGHLMIEKLLKALFVKVNNEFPPFIHNLLRLAEKCNLVLNEENRLFFATVTAFNINARYDDYKMSFQRTCTPEFSEIWIEQLRSKRLWIKELVKQ
ncbi:MAG TPA: HEPN domain-containing protein [Prolixibacteraceae bacterium]|jgi:HEPN domain-containing protein